MYSDGRIDEIDTWFKNKNFMLSVSYSQSQIKIQGKNGKMVMV